MKTVFVEIKVFDEQHEEELIEILNSSLTTHQWNITDVVIPSIIKSEIEKLSEENKILRFRVAELLKSQGKVWFLE